MSTTNFGWATNEDANIKEPLKELLEYGWKVRDIPKASNMNWVFKKISDDLGALRADFQKQEEGILKLNSELERLEKVLGDNREHCRKKHLKLKSQILRNRKYIADTGRTLVHFETELSQYLPILRKYPWPLKDWVPGDEDGR